MRKKSRLLALSIALASFLIAGCNDGGSPSAPLPPVDLAKDEEAIGQVRDKLDSLAGQRPSDIAQAALAYIQTLPDFKASGISDDGSVWAQLQDGVLYSIATNDPDLDVQPTASPKRAAAVTAKGPAVSSTQPASTTQRLATQRALTAAAGEIPGSATAYVFNAMEANRGIPADQIAQQLTAAGYNVVSGTGSLADWKGVSNAGILFAACHGTRLPDNDVKVFYMQSSTPHVKGDKTYLDDLAAHRMAFDDVAIDDDSLVRGKLPKYHWESRYLFKAEYLSNAKMFADNGFMFNAACSGTSAPGLTFAQSLKASNNLSVYGGWSQPVYIPDDNESMLFFFDRALGINQFAPADASNPPPAPWSKVVADMVSNARASGNGTNLNASDPSLYDSTGRNPIAVFSIQNLNGGDLSTLVPSATEATTDAANKQVVITGSFGSGTGRVSVDGADLTVKTWAPDKITATLPGASGKATVISKTGLISNKVSVTVESAVNVFPKNVGYLPGDALTIAATPQSSSSAAYTYHWKVTGSSLLTLQDISGTHTGTDFTTPDGRVYLTTTPSTVGTLTVSCTVTNTGSDSTLVGSGSTDYKEYPFSNQILTLSSVYQSLPKYHKYFAYVLIKKDPSKTVAPTIRWNTYVHGDLKSVSSVQGTLMTKIFDAATLGDPNVGAPLIVLTIANSQLIDPSDTSFTYNDVPYTFDMGDAIALLVDYKSWDATDTSDVGTRSVAAVNATVAKTQVVAGLVYP